MLHWYFTIVNVETSGFRGISEKNLHVQRTSGQSINCWLSCSNVGSDVSIVIDRFSPPANVHPSIDTDIPSSSFIFYGTRPHALDFSMQIAAPLYLMKIDWPSRVISTHLWREFLERKLLSSSIIPFIPRVFPHLDQFVNLDEVPIRNFREIWANILIFQTFFYEERGRYNALR